MKKTEIQRQQLKRNIMEQIIFRIDYAGMPAVETLIQKYFERFAGVFESYEITFHDHIELETLNIEEISRTLSVPVKELQRQEIHRMTESNLGPDVLTFDISKYYTVLHIRCKEYVSIDGYLKFFSDYLNFIKEYNQTISFRRFGLRKIGTNLYPEYAAIFEDFEQSNLYSSFAESDYSRDKIEYLDVLSTPDNKFKINSRRSIEAGYIAQPDGTTKQAFRVILDLDGFVDNTTLTELSKKSVNFAELLTELNNQHLWELFKMSVTEGFLNKYSK